MGRQKGSTALGGPSREVSLSLLQTQYDAVRLHAEPNDQTVATWIRRAIQQRLERESL